MTAAPVAVRNLSALPGAPAHLVNAGWRAPGEAHLIRANVRDGIPLADESVDLVVFSPPYWRARLYEDGGEYMPGQLGDEPTLQEHLDNLHYVTADLHRVMRKRASMFVNDGDKMAQRGGPGSNPSDSNEGRFPVRRKVTRPDRINPDGIRPKSIIGVPWRYALGCIDGAATYTRPDGTVVGGPLILRAEIIWEKPTVIPEGVRDRVRRTHEHVFHFTKRPIYYAAIDDLREPHTGGSKPSGPNATAQSWDTGAGEQHRTAHTDPDQFDPRGRTPGSVWEIASEPLDLPDFLGVDHYAAFPTELPRRLILGWSPPGICLECDHGRAPVSVVTNIDDRRGRVQGREGDSISNAHGADGRNGSRYRQQVEIIGYQCACTPHTKHKASGSRDADQKRHGSNKGGWHPDDHGAMPRVKAWTEYHFDGWEPAPTRPAVVLDPFLGTGTTVGVARALGRIGIGLDLSADYLRVARWRIFDSTDFDKVLARTNASRQGALL